MERNDLMGTLRGCRDMLRESAKQFRQLGDDGHAVMADIHAAEAEKALVTAEQLTGTLRVALDGLRDYHAYGQTMRAIGRGFDWGEYPGQSTTAFLSRAKQILPRTPSPMPDWAVNPRQG